MPWYTGPLGKRRWMPSGWYVLPAEWGLGARDFPGIGVANPHFKGDYVLVDLYRPGPSPDEVFYRRANPASRWVKCDDMRDWESLPNGWAPLGETKLGKSADYNPVWELAELVGKIIQIQVKNGSSFEGRLEVIGDFLTLDDWGTPVKVKTSTVKSWTVLGN